jgi:hypothetical protein
MEIFLNLLWVGIALSLLSVWRTRWIAQPRELRYAAWRQWTAVVCALIFLFFMVSITDDLHSDLMVFEECSAGRRHAASWDGSHLSPQHQAPVAGQALLGSTNGTHILFCLGAVALGHRAPETEFTPGVNFGRAPPVISL